MKTEKLARTCNIDGSEPKVFVLPKPQITAKLIVNPDGTGYCELTPFGKWLFHLIPDGVLEAKASTNPEKFSAGEQ